MPNVRGKPSFTYPYYILITLLGALRCNTPFCSTQKTSKVVALNPVTILLLLQEDIGQYLKIFFIVITERVCVLDTTEIDGHSPAPHHRELSSPRCQWC